MCWLNKSILAYLSRFRFNFYLVSRLLPNLNVRQNIGPGHLENGPVNSKNQESAGSFSDILGLKRVLPTLFQKAMFQYPVLAANLLNKGLKVLNASLRMFCHELL